MALRRELNKSRPAAKPRLKKAKCPVHEITGLSLRSKWAAGKARRGSISEWIRDRGATRPPAHFQRNPLGRGRLAVFLRCSLLTYQFRYARHSRLEKQPTGLRRKASYFVNRTRATLQSCWLSLRPAGRSLWIDRILRPHPEGYPPISDYGNSSVGCFINALNRCIEHGAILRIGLLERQPFHQGAREARHDTVIPAEAIIPFFQRVPSR